MSELANELRAIGRAINHEEYVDAGVVPLTLAHAAARIEAMEAALQEIAELDLGRAARIAADALDEDANE